MPPAARATAFAGLLGLSDAEGALLGDAAEEARVALSLRSFRTCWGDAHTNKQTIKRTHTHSEREKAHAQVPAKKQTRPPLHASACFA